MTEQTLAGGNVSNAVRIDDTVHRSMSPGADGTHALLRHFNDVGFTGAPRFLGVDDAGREVLSFIEGYVPIPDAADPRVMDDEALRSVARLVRAAHDATVGTPFAGDLEVCCHNDLAPNNTVYRETDGRLEAIALIDWDLCAAGSRIDDVAHICWPFLNLGPTISDIPEAIRKIHVIADAYGLDDRTDLIRAIIAWQERCADGIDDGAADGNPALIRLWADGNPTRIRDAARWVERNIATRWEVEPCMR